MTGQAPSQPVRVLGIDPGTAIVGWAVADGRPGGRPVAVAYGCIRTSKDHDTADRLREIADDLAGIIAQYRPTEIAIEKLFYFRNQTTIIDVAQARGAILLSAAQHGLVIGEYTPLQVKQALSGYGRATKAQMQDLTARVFGLAAVPQPDDAADALAIAFCHLNSRILAGMSKNR